MFLATPSLPSPAILPPFVLPFTSNEDATATRRLPGAHKRLPLSEPDTANPCFPWGLPASRGMH